MIVLCDAGAVTLVRNIAHPISLARRVMENTLHAFLGGSAVNQLAARVGIPAVSDDYLLSSATRSARKGLKKKNVNPSKITFV